MAKITYEDKVGLIDKGVQVNEIWDDDLNEIKSVVNENDEAVVSASGPITFKSLSSPCRAGSWGAPLTGAFIVADGTDAQEGACAVVIYSGSSSPEITGIDVASYSGEILASGTYSIYLNLINGRLNVFVFNPGNESPVDPRPNKITINEIT